MRSIVDRGADISDCGRYRYRLWRVWDFDKPLTGFIMLNPSTADATNDDPTIRKCMGFAERWGAGGIMVVNLFALRTPHPKVLQRAEAPAGPDNEGFLRGEMAACRPLVAAWGAHGHLQGRGDAIVRLAAALKAPLQCLGTTKNGQPRHPGRRAYATPLRPFHSADARLRCSRCQSTRQVAFEAHMKVWPECCDLPMVLCRAEK